ncbi:phosphonate ABC transporter ATP-binding protein [bacterium]|nr:MAG: phosphonate ABC transporter ATP-binding protein [bacterium]
MTTDKFAATSESPISVAFDNVSLTYPNGHQALKNVSLQLKRGEFIVIVGLSGAGKSSLIRCVNQLVSHTSGRVLVGGEDVGAMSPRQLRVARSHIGMIFQGHNLVKRSTVLKNVLTGRLATLPLWRSLLGLFPHSDVALAHECLERVGISEKAFVRADRLSGGQQQRVAIARALAQGPKVLLADEPVASLDPPTAHQVMRDLKRLSREENLTTLVNLHFVDMAMEYADRVIGMRAGEVVFDGPASSMTEATFEEIYGRKIRPDERQAPVESADAALETSELEASPSPLGVALVA